MQISFGQPISFVAVSLLIIGGLITLISWVGVRRSADCSIQTWFAGIVLQMASGLILFTAGGIWNPWIFWTASAVTCTAFYLALHSVRLLLNPQTSARPLIQLWLAQLAIFIILTGLNPGHEIALLFMVIAITGLKLATMATLRRVRKTRRLTATIMAEFAFAISITAGLFRLWYFALNGQLLQRAAPSLDAIVPLSLQAIAIILCCFYAIALVIQQAETRELEMRLETERLQIKQRLTEDHAAETKALMAQRDHMMILNSRFSSMSALSLLGGGVIHEISQPLQAARSALDVMTLSPKLSAEDVARYSTSLQQLIDRISDIVEGLRRLIREKDIAVEQVNAAQLLEKVFPIFQSEARRRNIIATCTIEPGAIWQLVSANPVMLERVMFNLAANALEAIGEAGAADPASPRILAVTAGMAPSDARPSLVIGFRDTGVGVPPASLDQIFNLLQSGKADGTGVGLYMVKVFVESWNGTIRVRPNDGDGRGTIVEITLPAQATS